MIHSSHYLCCSRLSPSTPRAPTCLVLLSTGPDLVYNIPGCCPALTGHKPGKTWPAPQLIHATHLPAITTRAGSHGSGPLQAGCLNKLLVCTASASAASFSLAATDGSLLHLPLPGSALCWLDLKTTSSVADRHHRCDQPDHLRKLTYLSSHKLDALATPESAACMTSVAVCSFA